MRSLLLAVAILFSFGGYAWATDPSLAVLYSLDGHALDDSGNGYDGIAFGPESTTDQFLREDSAYYFDGVDDYVSSPFDVPTDIDGFTMSVFAEADGFVDGMRHFLFTLSPRSGMARLRVNGDGDFVFGAKLANERWYDVEGPKGFTSGFMHIVGVYERQRALTLYVNGLRVGSIDLPAYDLNLGEGDGYDSTIGAVWGADGFWHGTISDVRLYDRAFAQDEVLDLMYQYELTAMMEMNSELESLRLTSEVLTEEFEQCMSDLTQCNADLSVCRESEDELYDWYSDCQTNNDICSLNLMSCYENEVLICHSPNSKSGGQEMTVASPSVLTHLEHGDTLGPCE